MYNDQKIARLQKWTRILDRATIVLLTMAAIYIQLSFSAVLSNWFRMFFGILAITALLIGFRVEIAQLVDRIREVLDPDKTGKYSLDNKL